MIKNNHIKTTLLLFFISGISIVNIIFKILNRPSLIALLLLFLVTNYIINGYNKSHIRFQKDITMLILIIVISYYLIIYLSGLFFGFNYNIYSQQITNIIKNIIVIIPIIILTELLRYSINAKINKNKRLLILSCLSFFLLDTTLTIMNIDFQNMNETMNYISLFILPSFSKNILLTFLSINQNAKIQILYRFVMELPIYLVPITPKLGVYLQSVLEFSLPIVVLLSVDRFFKKLPINQKIIKYKDNKITKIIIIIFLTIVVSLTSGLFNHQAVVIASGSMQPYLYKGDIVIVRKLNNLEKRKLEIGNILVFRRENKIIVHRIYRKIKSGNYVFFETKGDNNKNSDGYLIEENEIIGTTNIRIKFLGLPTIIINNLIH